MNVVQPEQAEEKKPLRFPIFESGKTLNQYRENIQLGYEHFLTGVLPSVHWIPYDWYRILVDDNFIEFDPDAYMTRNCFNTDTTEKEKAMLKRSQEYVWQLFEMAKKLKRNLYRNEPDEPSQH